jgi:energy-coupling factor transporter ATP-binding protein EcfA2
LRECTLAIPSGNVAVLAGPNGAGKTTLLHLWVGLTVPTAGGVAVLGSEAASSSAALDGIASRRRTRRCLRTCPALRAADAPEPDNLRAASGAVGPAVSRAESAICTYRNQLCTDCLGCILLP